MAAKPDYYRILGVDSQASEQEIRIAFRKKAFEYHPDRNRAADAGDRFKEINAAYLVLTDSVRRSQYDRSRRQRGTGAAAEKNAQGTDLEGAGSEGTGPARAGSAGASQAAEQAQQEQAQRSSPAGTGSAGAGSTGPAGAGSAGTGSAGAQASGSSPAAILRKICRFRIGITTESTDAEAAVRPGRSGGSSGGSGSASRSGGGGSSRGRGWCWFIAGVILTALIAGGAYYWTTLQEADAPAPPTDAAAPTVTPTQTPTPTPTPVLPALAPTPTPTQFRAQTPRPRRRRWQPRPQRPPLRRQRPSGRLPRSPTPGASGRSAGAASRWTPRWPRATSFLGRD